MTSMPAARTEGSFGARLRAGLAACACALAIGAMACGGDEGNEPAPAPPPAPAPAPAPTPPPATPSPAPAPTDPIVETGDPRIGEPIYVANCASCHGARGGGDGPLSASLDPRPVAHSDGAYMNALTDEYLAKVIREGGAAVGKSALMAPWGTMLTDQDIAHVVAYVRTLADPPYEAPAN